MSVDPVFARRLGKLAQMRDKADTPDEFFTQMVHKTVMFETKIERCNDKEIADLVIQMSADSQRKQDLGQALVCLLMTEKESAQKYIHLFVQMGDNWFQALYTLNMVMIEMFHRLNENCKDQILVFFREAIRCNVPKLESTLMNFLRTLNGSGSWESRLRLAIGYAHLFWDTREWMMNSTKTGSLYCGLLVSTYCHIVADIAQNNQMEKQKELMVNVIDTIVRRRPMETFLLGRELFYHLMRISKIPKIAELFADIFKKPKEFHIKGTVDDILFKSSVPNLASIRLSPELSKKVEFLITGMRLTNQTKHLEWFTSSYLKGPDAQTMRSELIRFVLYYMPQSQTNIYEARMQFIFYLLNQMPYGPESQWCKTALWFDWLFCDAQTPFHVLEPAFAIVRYCLGAQTSKANSLLEYLVKEIKEIFPKYSKQIEKSSNQAMKIMADVFASSNQAPVANILDNGRIDPTVREEIRRIFKDFVPSAPTIDQSIHASNNGQKAPKVDVKKEEYDRKSRSPSPIPRRNQQISKEEIEKELEAQMSQLRDDVKEIVQTVRNAFNSEESDDSDRGEAVMKFIQQLLDIEDTLEEEQHWIIGHCLQAIIGRPENSKSLVPEANTKPNQDPFQEVFSHPVFIVFRNLCMTPTNETTSRTPLIRIIAAMREKDNYITILLLYLVKCGLGTINPNSDPVKCYEEVASEMEKEVSELLTDDLETVALEDNKLFSVIIPFVFEKFAQEISSSPDVLQVICSYLDSIQLSTIVGCMIRQGTTLFRKDNVCNIVTASMEWSTTTQLMLWQLIHSDAVPMDWLLPLVPKIKSEQHSETAVNLLLTLRRLDREPGMNLLRTIFSRPPSKDDFFTINCFRILLHDTEQMCNKVAELIGQLIKKLINNGEIHMPAVNAQKNQGKKAAPKLSLEQLLHHLTMFIESCQLKEQNGAETFLTKIHVQEAFKTIGGNDKTTMMKPKFGFLFNTIELLSGDSPQSSRTLRGNRGANHTPNSKKRPKDDDDEVMAISSKQKKRQVITLDSDSD